MAITSRIQMQLPIALAVLMLLVGTCTAFYLPGVAPRTFKKGDNLNIRVQSLFSSESHLQFDYYQLPYCEPKDEVEYAENLGEALMGEKSFTSMYLAPVLEDLQCQVICRELYNSQQMEEFQDFTILNYFANMRADNLPLAEVRELVYADDPEGNIEYQYQLGYPVGRAADNDMYFLNNHLRFTVLYHPVEKDEEHPDPQGVFIVGFQVEPHSIKHTYDGEWKEGCKGGECGLKTCGADAVVGEGLQIHVDEESTQEVVWTYDIAWKQSDVKWASRWDVYLNIGEGQDKIHWFSVINSIVVSVFLTMLVAVIMARILRKDLAMYNELATDEEGASVEETGWKLVYGDVFRAPSNPRLMAVLLGSGMQLLMMSTATLIFATLGFLSPSNRGALMTCILLFYVLLGSSAGYISARFAKLFGETNQFRVTLMAGCVLPGIVFFIFFLINLVVWIKGSSGAVPFGTMVALMLLWFGVSMPMVFFGGYLGFKKEGYSVPNRINPIPRMVPQGPWYLGIVGSAFAGLLPFSVVFVELTYILSSFWNHRFYYLFGFLATVSFVLLVTIIEVCIVLCYLQLCAEDHHWWWRSFVNGSSVGIYLWIYSAYYYTRHVHMTGVGGMISGVVFSGYVLIIAIAIMVLAGSVGTIACFLFNRIIYGAVKID